jgi:8-oxo-dGTP pyrophosphatase MutT (NUDIX family)
VLYQTLIRLGQWIAALTGAEFSPQGEYHSKMQKLGAPRGGVDLGESLAKAAVRETLE